jgi:hypothetical protein
MQIWNQIRSKVIEEIYLSAVVSDDFTVRLLEHAHAIVVVVCLLRDGGSLACVSWGSCPSCHHQPPLIVDDIPSYISSIIHRL